MKNAVFKTKPRCKVSRMVAGLSAALCLAVPTLSRADAAYADDFIEASDSSVRSIALPSGIAYVFANPEAGELSVSLKADMTLKRLLVVGGGGGGGSPVGGGGGGGGVIAVDTPVELVAGTSLTLAVGAGGAASHNGGDSSLAFADQSFVAVGGGSGGWWGDFGGHAGGSGGGAVSAGQVGGSGTSKQGNAGGSYPTGNASCGGGGATQGGGSGTTTKSGDGGEGLASDITGETVVYGSGGGGGGSWGSFTAGKGGTNAGSGGDSTNGHTGGNGVDGTGGGGGGEGSNVGTGGKGGSGTVILLVKPKTGLLIVDNDNTSVPVAAVEPTAGAHVLTPGTIVAATDWTDAERNLQGECLGYSVRYYDETSGTWGEAATSEETSFACPTGASGVWLTWRWNVSLLGTAYSDEFLQTTDPAVRSIAFPTGVAYVFTNAAAGAVSVLVRDDMRLERFLVVGGGGCGGQPAGGGGGGGGVIDGDEPVVLEAGSQLTIAVGAGGFGKASEQNNGGNTSFAFGGRSYVAVGGGSGAYWGGFTGYAGGSGGGATAHAAGGGATVGQGFDGGGWPGGDYASGGGGATEPGQGGSAAKGGDGGEGLASDITGVSVVYGSGGGGSGIWGNSAHGKGGTNAGDGGGNDNAYRATAGVDGTGGGGGGDCYKDNVARVGKGGCGTVILLLKPKTAMVIVDNNQPLIPATAVEPAPGAHAFAEGAVMRALDWSDPETLVKGRCIGYEVRPYDPATGDWGEPVTSEETVFTVPSSLQDGFKLIWRWDVSLEDDACFRDRLAECSATPTLKKRIRLDDETCEYVYAFSNPDSGSVSLLLKKEATLLRTLVVGGGGGGGSYASGGGGGGGVIATTPNLSCAAGDLVLLSVGAGGEIGTNGGDSSLTVGGVTSTAIGGGTGGLWGDADNSNHASSGGSGGGGSMNGSGASGTPRQGNAGGNGGGTAGGGGGASKAGQAGSSSKGGDGGEGLPSDITGVSVVYGSGGGGGGIWGSIPGGKGGTNAGDGGGNNNGYRATDGVNGSGGGGGGDCMYNGSSYPGKGGSGTVILRLRVKESRTGMTLILR